MEKYSPLLMISSGLNQRRYFFFFQYQYKMKDYYLAMSLSMNLQRLKTSPHLQVAQTYDK